MSKSEKRLVQALKGKVTDRTPFWFMRQAGRYLPEYRELRKKTKNFLDFCYSPEQATEATLQPIRRFGMDGAIIFSDILVIPHALGMGVRFEEGRGPILSPVQKEKDLKNISIRNFTDHLSPVYQALRLTKKSLPEDVALIGFVGAPWTLACYSVEGKTSKDFDNVKTLAAADDKFFSKLIEIFTDAVIAHAINQIEAGAEVIQLFDSWAGVLSEEPYRRWVIDPTRHIVASIKKRHPEVPVVGFPRQSGARFETYAKNTGVDAVSFDQSVPVEWAKRHLQPVCRAQGCLNQQLLADDKAAMLAETKHIMDTLDKPFVFNLGHGILPHTPIENMQALCDYLRHP